MVHRAPGQTLEIRRPVTPNETRTAMAATRPLATADAAPAAPSDINTGGQAPSGETTGDATIEEVTTGDSSTIATEPGSGAAPASGATGTAAADGIGATDSGETGRDRPRNHDTGSVDEAPGG